MAKIARANLPTLKKTGSYYLLHVLVASVVAYAVTGSLAMSLTLSLLEPAVQAVAFFFHEKAWQRAVPDAAKARATPNHVSPGSTPTIAGPRPDVASPSAMA